MRAAVLHGFYYTIVILHVDVCFNVSNELGIEVVAHVSLKICYDIKLVRKEEGKSYWKIPLCDDDATREK